MDYSVPPPQMDIEDDDEPQVVFEGTTLGMSKNSRRRRARKARAQQSANPVPEPVTIDEDSVEEIMTSREKNSAGDQIKVEPEFDQTTILVDDSEDEDIGMALDDNTASTDAIFGDDVSYQNDGDTTMPIDVDDSEIKEAEDHAKSVAADAEIQDVTPPEILQATRLRQAVEFKEQGNTLFQTKEYHKALAMYTKAIDTMPEAAFYGNRSACHMMLKRYKLAQADARTAVQIDPAFTNGYLRLLRASLALGDIVAAESTIATFKQSNFAVNVEEEQQRISILKAVHKEMKNQKEKKDFRTVLYLCDRGLTVADGDLELKTIKADTLLKLNRMTEAQELCTEVLQVDSCCVDAYYIRSICLYGADNLEKSVQFLKQALQFAPDNSLVLGLFRKFKKIKDLRAEGGNFFERGKYTEAKVKYVECVNIVKEFEYPSSIIESKMSLNLSLIAFKQSELDESLTFVNRAVELNPSYLKALLHRAQVHRAKEMFTEAGRDYETAQKVDPKNPSYRKYIQDMKLAAKKAGRKDYYKILGVDKNATQDEVKKAYKKRALIHHPDRHSSATESVQKEQEKQFKELGQAYEILSDPKKRNRYDAGHDLDSPEGGFGNAEFDTSNLFNVFFGGSGMGGMGTGPRPSGFQHRSYNSNYHPY